MAQNQKETSGFTLPPPEASVPAAKAASASATTTPAASSASSVPVGTVGVTTDTSSRDLLVGGFSLVILFIVFFFAKNTYANALVGKRVPPAKANASGWWLFVFLALAATGVVLAAVNTAKFMVPLVIVPIILICLLALIMAFVALRK